MVQPRQVVNAERAVTQARTAGHLVPIRTSFKSLVAQGCLPAVMWPECSSQQNYLSPTSRLLPVLFFPTLFCKGFDSWVGSRGTKAGQFMSDSGGLQRHTCRSWLAKKKEREHAPGDRLYYRHYLIRTYLPSHPCLSNQFHATGGTVSNGGLSSTYLPTFDQQSISAPSILPIFPILPSPRTQTVSAFITKFGTCPASSAFRSLQASRFWQMIQATYFSCPPGAELFPRGYKD